jgi:hypothetical protein
MKLIILVIIISYYASKNKNTNIFSNIVNEIGNNNNFILSKFQIQQIHVNNAILEKKKKKVKLTIIENDDIEGFAIKEISESDTLSKIFKKNKQLSAPLSAWEVKAICDPHDETRPCFIDIIIKDNKENRELCRLTLHIVNKKHSDILKDKLDKFFQEELTGLKESVIGTFGNFGRKISAAGDWIQEKISNLSFKPRLHKKN